MQVIRSRLMRYNLGACYPGFWRATGGSSSPRPRALRGEYFFGERVCFGERWGRRRAYNYRVLRGQSLSFSYYLHFQVALFAYNDFVEELIDFCFFFMYVSCEFICCYLRYFFIFHSSFTFMKYM